MPFKYHNRLLFIFISLGYILLMFFLFFVQTVSLNPASVAKGPIITPTLVFYNPSPMQQAKAYLKQQYGFQQQNLSIVNTFKRNSTLLNRNFKAVTILEHSSGRFFNLLVDDKTNQVIESNVIQQAEEVAHKTKYGKLQPALYRHLQKLTSTDTVLVTIWATRYSGEGLTQAELIAQNTLATKYPIVQPILKRGGKILEIADPQLNKQIYTEYITLVNNQANKRTQRLVSLLENRHPTDYRTTEGLPAITVNLTKADIEWWASQKEVGAIYLASGGHRRPLMNVATLTTRTPSVWEQGYDGEGITVAIMENDNVDFTSDTTDCPVESNNCFQNPGDIQVGRDGEGHHATMVASIIASTHNTYQGMAPGVTLISAGIPGLTPQDDIDTLVWAFDHWANIVNASYGWCNAINEPLIVDKAFDYYARIRNKLIVVSAGNKDKGCSHEHMASPAKAWNVLAVGVFDDQEDANWNNDVMADISVWVNPISPNGDHEKPELVAPVNNIQAVSFDGWVAAEETATSFSAPQVSGLAALLMDINSSLTAWPESTRAILLASATHNITGSTIISGGNDLKDGAGGINSTLAAQIAHNFNTSTTLPCSTSCWWGFSITNNNFPINSNLYRDIVLNKGDKVRVAIAWWANADCPSEDNCSFSQLDTNLNLNMLDPDGEWVNGAWSASWDNNYELIEFIAAKSGTHRITVYKHNATEDSNYLGIAFLRIQNIYIPLVLK